MLPRRKPQAGFTLVEVLVALLLGTVGLIGTMAVQQAVIGASKAANDSAVALRLAGQRLEEFNTVLTTGAPLNASPLPNTDQMAALATGTWSDPTYLNAEGMTATAPTPEYRWIRSWRVVNLGASLPFVISVTVTYATDTGDPKTVRLDMERRKSW
jgi:prepilin-type N-terminal cleavage/methylation domain-containing protein